MRKLLVCLVMMLFLSVSATALKFQASLTTIRIVAQPGQMFTRHFILRLDKNEKRAQFRARTEDWWHSEDGKQSFFKPAGTLKRSCASWIRLNPVESLVNGGETLDIRLTLMVPAETKPGGYWCVLTVDEVPDPLKAQDEGAGMHCLTSISLGVFVTVGNADKQATITAVSLTDKEALVKLCNQGNCPLNVEGRLEFASPDGSKSIAVIPFTRTWLLPEPINTAELTAALPDASHLPSGHYQMRAIFDIGLSHYIGLRKDMQISRETSISSPENSVRP